jgi:hypothetical protein
MNRLLVGTADHTEQLLHTTAPFLLIDDGPIADAFLEHFPRAKLFDISKHSFNPLKGMDYKRARDFAQALYTASPEGKDTLTVRNGRRALIRLLLQNPTRLDRIDGDRADPAQAEALATIEDVLLSPVLKNVLCKPTNFSFKGSVVAKLNRAELGDFDAFVLASLLIGQTKGQVIIPDFGFYGCPLHMSFIRQERLTAGVQFLAELPSKLRQSVLTIPEKWGAGCTYDDAAVLASYEGLIPGEVGHTEFVADRLA